MLFKLSTVSDHSSIDSTNLHILQELQEKHFRSDMKVIFWLKIHKKKIKNCSLE